MPSGPYERFYPGEDKGLLDPTWGGGAHRLSAPSISEHGGTIGLLTAGAGLGLGGYRLGKLGYQGLTKAGEAMDRVIPTIKESVPLWLDLVMSNLSGSSQRERLEESAKKLGVDPNMVLERSSNVKKFPGLLEDFGPDSPYWAWREDPDTTGDVGEIYEKISLVDDFPASYYGSWIPSKYAEEYPVAGEVVDGRVVSDIDVPNTSSIAASLEQYDVLPGIREVQMKDDDDNTFAVGRHYSELGNKRINKLANEMKKSNEITPLIVVVGRDGIPYILEGSTRVEALAKLGAKSFPALVVIDQSEE
jgi:hypothetical protein